MQWRLKRLSVLAGALAAGLLASSGAFAEDAVTTDDVNMRAGPGTGYRPTGARWEEMKRLRHVVSASNPEQEVDYSGEAGDIA